MAQVRGHTVSSSNKEVNGPGADEKNDEENGSRHEG